MCPSLYLAVGDKGELWMVSMESTMECLETLQWTAQTKEKVSETEIWENAGFGKKITEEDFYIN